MIKYEELRTCIANWFLFSYLGFYAISNSLNKTSNLEEKVQCPLFGMLMFGLEKENV